MFNSVKIVHMTWFNLDILCQKEYNMKTVKKKFHCSHTQSTAIIKKLSICRISLKLLSYQQKNPASVKS